MKFCKFFALLLLLVTSFSVLPSADAYHRQQINEWGLISDMVPRRGPNYGGDYQKSGRYNHFGGGYYRSRDDWDPGIDRYKGGPARRVNYINPYWW